MAAWRIACIAAEVPVPAASWTSSPIRTARCMLHEACARCELCCALRSSLLGACATPVAAVPHHCPDQSESDLSQTKPLLPEMVQR